MATWKQHILVLLTVVCLFESVFSHENPNQLKTASNENRELYDNNEYYQAKNSEKEENLASKRGSFPREDKDIPEADKTDNRNFENDKKIENEWNFTKMFNYLLSFIYEMDEEERNEMQNLLGKMKSKNHERQPLEEQSFSVYNGECRTDDCSSISRIESKRHQSSFGENPDVSFDSEDNDNVKQTQEHDYKNSNQTEGDTSEKKVTVLNGSKDNSQSIDSNPDVAFDSDGSFEKIGISERKYASKISKVNQVEISESESTSVDEKESTSEDESEYTSENGSESTLEDENEYTSEDGSKYTSEDEREDHIPDDGSDFYFEISRESAAVVKDQEIQSDQKSLPAHNDKEYHEVSGSNNYSYSDIEKKNVSEKEKSVPYASQKPVSTEELPKERNLSETQSSRKSKEPNESKTGDLNHPEKDIASEEKSSIKHLQDEENSYKRQSMQDIEKEETSQESTNLNEKPKKESSLVEAGASRNNSMNYKNDHDNTGNDSRNYTSNINGKEKSPIKRKISKSKEDNVYSTETPATNDAMNLTTKLTPMKIEREPTQDPSELNNIVAHQENTDSENNLKDKNNAASKDVITNKDEKNISTEEQPMKMSPNDKLHSGPSTPSLQQQQSDENSDASKRLDTMEDRGQLRSKNSHDEKPGTKSGEDRDEYAKLSGNDVVDETEGVELSEEVDDEYYEEEDETEDDTDEDDDTYEYDNTFSDYFRPNLEDNYFYDEESGHVFVNLSDPLVTAQTTDNITEYPKFIGNKSYHERNESNVNNYQPPERFNTILEYLYKFSNNPLFGSLKQQNDTEEGSRNVTRM